MIGSPKMGGLPPHAVSRMRAVFAAHPAVDRVVLFGSRAKGNFKNGSDIDLALCGRLGYSEMGAIACELDDLLLPWEIDLLLYDKIDNSDLRAHIDRVGQTFYSRMEAAA